MSLTRTRPPNPIRAALQQAMLSPRVQQAVAVFVNALVDEGEAILQAKYSGERLRLYMPKGMGQAARDERKRRVRALAAPPSNLGTEQIAALEGISVRRVQQMLKGAD
jgi:hypothetical protein